MAVNTMQFLFQKWVWLYRNSETSVSAGSYICGSFSRQGALISCRPLFEKPGGGEFVSPGLLELSTSQVTLATTGMSRHYVLWCRLLPYVLHTSTFHFEENDTDSNGVTDYASSIAIDQRNNYIESTDFVCLMDWCRSWLTLRNWDMNRHSACIHSSEVEHGARQICFRPHSSQRPCRPFGELSPLGHFKRDMRNFKLVSPPDTPFYYYASCRIQEWIKHDSNVFLYSEIYHSTS